MTSFEVRAPSAPSHTSDDGAWPSMCFHGWKWSLTKAESKPVFSASSAKSSSLAGANCSADALYPSLSTAIVLGLVRARFVAHHGEGSMQLGASIPVGDIGAGPKVLR